eukprot:TRINITY_DN16350_c0_g1_i2.p1 TRINITY_DN16350_c0_g1~~TRINITY_DN16350_c0_g1_i2.p1  ORF type:complete len:332 (+),score=43.30 TRINITY_DN16350_c0_g1_i2:74-1069(+)
MASKKELMTSMMQHAVKLKTLREKAERFRTLSTQPGDDESDEEESWTSIESVDDGNRRSCWPQPARFPTKEERKILTNSTDDWVIEDAPDLSGNESCSSGESDSEGDFARSSDYDVRSVADSKAPGFKTPLPQSATIRDCPDWRARMVLHSKRNPCKEETKATTAKERQSISNSSSARLVSGRSCASQACSLTASSSSEKPSSEVLKQKKHIPLPRTSLRSPEPSDFLGGSACRRLRALCAASSLDDEDEKEEPGFACDTRLAASSSDKESDESDESDDEACPPQRTKARSDFPHPSEYLSPRAYQRLRALCGASPLDESAALLKRGELSE